MNTFPAASAPGHEAAGSDRGASGGGAATRAELVGAARKLFTQKGFDGASIRAITRAAGANLGAVTYHFGSKRDLYGAVLEEGLRPLAARVQDAVASDGSARDRMLRVVEAYFEHFGAHPDIPRLLLQEVAAGKPPPPVVLEILLGIKEAVAGLQVEGTKDGSVRQGHPVLTALSVVSQPIYLTLVAPMLRAFAGLDLDDPETRRAAHAHVIAFVRAGLTPDTETES